MSLRAAARLIAYGYLDVREYPGGLEEWREVEGAIEEGAAGAATPSP